MAPGWEERVEIVVKDDVVQFVSWTEDDGRIIDYFMTFSGYWIWEERYTRNRGLIQEEDAVQLPAVWLLKNKMSENESMSIKLWATQWDDPTERIALE
jgi:hypothetical protein